MPAPLLQLADELSGFVLDVARSFDAATLTLAPRPQPDAAAGLQVLAPQPGEGVLSAWHRALDTVEPQAVWVHSLAGASPSLLLDLRERGIPYAVFLHDFAPICPTRRLWHRRQERCSGPGRTGWKCAWCTGAMDGRGLQRGGAAPSQARGLIGLPLRWLALRQRPQAWRTALLRADALIAPSRFAREYWIAQGAPPERIAVIPPMTDASTAPPTSSTSLVNQSGPPTLLYAGGWLGQWDDASGAELLTAALDNVRRPLRLLAPGLPAAAAELLRAGLTSRHQLEIHADGGADAITVVPARWEIPFSRQVWQAQAAGHRVVATALGGLTEQIIHATNGYLATPDDPVSLADSIQEACDEAINDRGPAWDRALVMRQTRAEAAAATAQLRRLLNLLTDGEPEIAVQLDHHDWLAQLPNGRDPVENLGALITALRLAGIDAAPADADAAFARRADAVSRRRRLELNHALAFFRACGCFRVTHWPAPPPDDEREVFRAWGVELVAAETLPCGILHDRREGDDVDPQWFRRRFPQARAGVALTPAGVETAAWDE